jgi:hypothetical protein
MPKDKYEWDIDPKDEAVVAVDAMLEKINQTIRKLEPGILNSDCSDSLVYFVDWIFGRRKLD